jgi:hypothetical protein
MVASGGDSEATLAKAWIVLRSWSRILVEREVT